ncbi:MAG TPA: amidohydrolase family protein [Candidatus Acidoferrum sp.]|nr:amidohydrolase family protein [Candidatus Acidoferrum sp.]
MMRQIEESRNRFSRREFLATTTGAVASTALAGCAHVAAPIEPIIDIHQHTDYTGRADEHLIQHQRVMGVTHSVLLPAGRWFGLEAAVGPNEHAYQLVRKYPKRFSYFSNDVPYVADARKRMESFLKRGAIGIGEQKFEIDADSVWLKQVAEFAQEYDVPVLMHFQHAKYNTGIDRFHKVLEKYPRVNFIGHAQTWWANIDKNHNQPDLYPKTRVTAGGITDRLLSDYPNMFGDTSAGSGLNAFTRDEGHMRGFLARHENKLLFGSDCNDEVGHGAKCQGAQIIAMIRKLAPSKEVERKILHENAKRVLKVPRDV